MTMMRNRQFHPSSLDDCITQRVVPYEKCRQQQRRTLKRFNFSRKQCLLLMSTTFLLANLSNPVHCSVAATVLSVEKSTASSSVRGKNAFTNRHLPAFAMDSASAQVTSNLRGSAPIAADEVKRSLGDGDHTNKKNKMKKYKRDSDIYEHEGSGAVAAVGFDKANSETPSNQNQNQSEEESSFQYIAGGATGGKDGSEIENEMRNVDNVNDEDTSEQDDQYVEDLEAPPTENMKEDGNDKVVGEVENEADNDDNNDGNDDDNGDGDDVENEMDDDDDDDDGYTSEQDSVYENLAEEEDLEAPSTEIMMENGSPQTQSMMNQKSASTENMIGVGSSPTENMKNMAGNLSNSNMSSNVSGENESTPSNEIELETENIDGVLESPEEPGESASDDGEFGGSHSDDDDIEGNELEDDDKVVNGSGGDVYYKEEENETETKNPVSAPTSSPVTTESSPSHTQSHDDEFEEGGQKDSQNYNENNSSNSNSKKNKPLDLTEEEWDIIKKQELRDEKIVEEKVGGWAIFLGLLLMIFTAYQMSENPDGIYASICRLAITVTGCIFKILLFPCKKLFGSRFNGYSHHLVTTQDFRDPYSRSRMELM